jgi:hypothetical protein
MSAKNPATCSICNENPCRKHGVECRSCYKRNWLRRKRHLEFLDPSIDTTQKTNERRIPLSLEQAERELDRIAYEEWIHRSH